MAVYFGAECKLPTLLNFEPMDSAIETTTMVSTMYSTTSTAKPTTTTTLSTSTISTFTEDPLASCQIEGLPTSKEEGKRELKELIK